ncbi:MAG TPA: sigma-70 family RNA polymerase sigma factor [Kiritimatiellia bacterium]|nr:sigma-70 family RNA polymerase sigma factor [Kiritimatiellia bacterium]
MSDSATDPDIEAMLRLRDGDDLALNEIMDRWTSRVASYLTRNLGNESDALDLTQETFVGVYRARLRYQPKSKFSTWLFGIATNQARQRLRWRRRHPEVAFELEHESVQEQNPLIVAIGDPGKNALQAERAAAVRDAIMDLPDDLREAVVLSEYEDLSHAEIATIAGCSTKAVETRLYRARKLLKSSLTRFM